MTENKPIENEAGLHAYIQTARVEAKTGIIRIVANNMKGLIYLASGRIVNAHCSIGNAPEYDGEQALRTLLTHSDLSLRYYYYYNSSALIEQVKITSAMEKQLLAECAPHLLSQTTPPPLTKAASASSKTSKPSRGLLRSLIDRIRNL